MSNYCEKWSRPAMLKSRLIVIVFLSISLLAGMAGAEEWTLTNNSLEDVHRCSTATRLKDGRVLIAGGVILGTGDYPEVGAVVFNKAYLYDPNTRTFTRTGDLKQPRLRHTATLLPDGKVLIAGGYVTGITGPGGPQGVLDTAEIYDPATGIFSYTAGKLNEYRTLHTSTLLDDGTVLLVGGWWWPSETFRPDNRNNNYSEEAEIYNPVTGTFSYPTYPSPTYYMKEQRSSHTATLMADGRVLIWGGVNDVEGGIHSTGEVYDPASKSFSNLIYGTTAYPYNPLPRESHSATLLKDGNVLIVGGWNGTGPEERLGLVKPIPCNPDAESCTPYQYINAPCNLLTPRQFQTSTLLADGSVLIAGGKQRYR